MLLCFPVTGAAFLLQTTHYQLFAIRLHIKFSAQFVAGLSVNQSPGVRVFYSLVPSEGLSFSTTLVPEDIIGLSHVEKCAAG